MSRRRFAGSELALWNAGGSATSVVKSLIIGPPWPRAAMTTNARPAKIAVAPPGRIPRPRNACTMLASATTTARMPPSAKSPNPTIPGTTRAHASAGPTTNTAPATRPRVPRMLRPCPAITTSLSVDALVAPGPFPVAEHELLDLPRRRLRQRPERDRLRALEVGEQATAVRDDVRLGRRPALLRDDERLRHLAPLLVRHGDDRDLEDVGVPRDRLLHLDGRDVLTARDDDVLRAVPELDVAVGMHDGDVARVEPAAAERLGGGRGVLEVALHHVVPAHHDLAHCRGVGRDVAQLGVDHAELARDDVRDALASAEAGARL